MSFNQERRMTTALNIYQYLKEHEEVTVNDIELYLPHVSIDNIMQLLYGMEKEKLIFHTHVNGIDYYFLNELPF